jgi:hypothetical protein
MVLDLYALRMRMLLTSPTPLSNSSASGMVVKEML